MNIEKDNIEKKGAQAEDAGAKTKKGSLAGLMALIGVGLIGIVMAVVLVVGSVGKIVTGGAEPISPLVAQRGFDNYIAVFADRPTVVYVWDYATVDGDVAGINGVPIVVDVTPKSIVLPPGITHIVLTTVKDGWARGITPAARSTAGSITMMRGVPGQSVIVPTRIVR